ncbi:MAG TPA: DUF4956 domain-containing protein [Gemmatimonadaceae bacterium]|nr:DUF4956 domain-containing protein [Gemmatimonadaceae bacterium]
MIVLKQIIDIMTQGSDRPLRRLFAYYAVVAVVVAVLWYLFPDIIRQVAGKSVDTAAGSPQLLPDALVADERGVAGFGAGSLGEVSIVTLLILLGTIVLMLPVSWVYMSARPIPGHSQALVQTLIILPIVVAGIIIVVQNSLALAFSLAGVVGAVRFRTNLRDTRDLVFVFLSIGVGFAAGVQSLAVGAIVSIVFNLLLLLTWRYDYGRNILTPTASSQWAGPLESLASQTGAHEIPDRDLVLSLTPEKADVLADRFDRVRKVIGSKSKKPRYNAVLTISTDYVPEAQAQAEMVLQKLTKRWKLDEVVQNTGKPSQIYYLLRLKKTVPRDEVLTAIHNNSDGMIASADLELAEPLQSQDGKKS